MVEEKYVDIDGKRYQVMYRGVPPEEVLVEVEK